MKNKLITLSILSLMLCLLNACETGLFIREVHPYYYTNDTQYRIINWGYTIGDPLLNASYYGNFYSPTSPYGSNAPIIQESEGAIGQ